MSDRFAATRRYLPMICVMLIWGSMGLASRRALAELSPMAVLCLRSGIGALFLLPFARRRRLWPDRRDRLLLALLALIGVVLCNFFYFHALRRTQLASVAILYATGPVITALLAAAVLHEPIRQSRAVGVVLAFAGVVALLLAGQPSGAAGVCFGAGECLELMSVVCLAVFTVLSRRIRSTPPESAVFFMMLVSFLATLPFAAAESGSAVLRASPLGWLSVAYLGVFCSGLGYLLQQRSIARIGAAASSAFLNGISPITVLSAAVFLHERVSPLQAACMAVILVGVVLNAANRSLFPRVSRG